MNGEETNMPDKRVQPTIHGSESKDSKNLCLMDLIPTDGLFKKFFHLEISIIQSRLTASACA